MSEHKKEVALKLWRQLGVDRWDHPDPRLSGIILMMSANGFKPRKISEMTGVSLHQLKRYYSRELANGASAVDMEIYNSVVSKALNGENPKLALKAAEVYYKYKSKMPQTEEEPDEVQAKSQADSVKGMVDPKKLSVDELRTLTHLLEKAKIDGPSLVIDVKAKRRE